MSKNSHLRKKVLACKQLLVKLPEKKQKEHYSSEEHKAPRRKLIAYMTQAVLGLGLKECDNMLPVFVLKVRRFIEEELPGYKERLRSKDETAQMVKEILNKQT